MTQAREGKTEPTESASEATQWQSRREARASVVLPPVAEAATAATAGVDPLRKSSLLCSEISRISGGTCFLGFSRGKDSIAAWLQLRKFFTRIIPFHCASAPHLGFVDESLAYYERFFKTPVIRLMDGTCMTALTKLFWQPPGSEEAIDAMELWRYDKHDVIDTLQREMGLPKAWCAFGINMTDSIDRRIWVEKIGGRNDDRMTFYPCFDWKKEEIVGAIKDAGVMLPKDYTRANRSMAAIPSSRHMAHIREWAPADYDRVLLMYPMIEAELARQEFRRAKYQGKAIATACRCTPPEGTA